MKKFILKKYPVLFFSLLIISFLLILYFFNIFTIAPKIVVFLICILFAVFLGKLKILLKDWLIFLSFLYLFDSLRGLIYILICKFNFPVYTLYAIKLEKFFFGGIPSVELQRILLKGTTYNEFSWFEKFLTVLYGTHFIAFLFIGFLIWIKKSNYFKAYKNSFLILITTGLFGYFIIPTTPPWIASELFNLIPKIIRFNAILFNLKIPDLKAGFDVNPIAAMPSLHAAFPVLCSLILWRFYRWKASLFYLYTVLILFTIVYTGDHYVVDILAGIFLACLSYFLAFKIKKLSIKPFSKKVKIIKKEYTNSMVKNIIFGFTILIIGISISFSNKNYYKNNSNLFELSMPTYIDFFRHEENYRQNYYVQFYFGNYYMFRGKYEKALFYFKRALSLSKNSTERWKVLRKIRMCEMELKNKINY